MEGAFFEGHRFSRPSSVLLVRPVHLLRTHLDPGLSRFFIVSHSHDPAMSDDEQHQHNFEQVRPRSRGGPG